MVGTLKDLFFHFCRGDCIGQALSRGVWTVSSVLQLLFACGVVNTLERYAAKAAAFSLSVTPQIPSSCRSGGICIIGLFSSLVAFQMEWSSVYRLVM